MDKHYSKFSFVFIVTTCLILATTVSILIAPVNAIPVERHVGPGQTYTTITAAIAASSSYDTIIVHPDTYAESVTINIDYLIIIGDANSRPLITGGLKFDTDLTGLVFKNFVVSGVATTHNSIVRMYGAITDLTIENCVFDGENVAGRYGFTGGQIEGDLTVRTSELKNILGWAVFDTRSGSGGDGSAMDTITFADNYIHDCEGSITFRGLSTDWTDNVYIYGNTFENIGDEGVSDTWAAFEVNRATNVDIYNNEIRNVVEGSWGEGQAMQLWKVGAVNINGNTIENCYQGIYFLKWPAAETYSLSAVTINYNNFVGTDQDAVNVAAGLTGGPVDAENNWWGVKSGPSHTGNPGGTGDSVSDNVDYDPWISVEVEGCKSETVPGIGTVDATVEADVSVYIDATGTHTVTCVEYSGNPDSAFSNEIGKYYDVRLDDDTSVNSLTIRFYYTDADIAGRVESTLQMHWWDKTTSTWKLCSQQILHTSAINGYSGYIEVTITATTEPTLNYLTTDPPFGAAADRKTPEAVGGEVFKIDKLTLLTPYIMIISLMLAAILIKKRLY